MAATLMTGGLTALPPRHMAALMRPSSWMEDTDVALNDEGQQYGNLDEASAIARAPRKCLVI